MDVTITKTTAKANAPRFNKLRFFQSLGYEPHPGQLAIHISTAPRRVVACGVRWGKTRCAAMEGLAAAMQPQERSFGWVVAPTYDLAEKVYREIIHILSHNLRHRVIAMRDNDKRILLRNMAGGVSEIRAKSADNPVSLLGEGLDWVIADEAARLKPSIWEGHLSQRLIDKRGWALLISTPRGKGWYFDLFQRGQGRDGDYASWNHPSTSNPYLDAALIEAERARLPERVFRQEYLGEFLEGSGAVFRHIRDLATLEPWPLAPVAGERYWAGLDLAKVEDFTVLCITDSKRRLVYADRWNRIDWDQTVSRVKAAAERYNDPLIAVDSTGAGEPVYEQLLKADLRCLAYPFTKRSKSELVDNLAILCEKRAIALPTARAWPVGIDELESFEYAVSDSGNVSIGAPPGYHDDAAIAAALAYWHHRLPRDEDHVMTHEEGALITGQVGWAELAGARRPWWQGPEL